MDRNRIIAWACGILSAILVIMAGKSCVSYPDASKKSSSTEPSTGYEDFGIIRPNIGINETEPPPTEQQFDEFGRPITVYESTENESDEPATDENGNIIEPATDENGNPVESENADSATDEFEAVADSPSVEPVTDEFGFILNTAADEPSTDSVGLLVNTPDTEPATDAFGLRVNQSEEETSTDEGGLNNTSSGDSDPTEAPTDTITAGNGYISGFNDPDPTESTSENSVKFDGYDHNNYNSDGSIQATIPPDFVIVLDY